MNVLKARPLLVPGVVAIALWIVGLVVTNDFSDKIPSHPTDAQLLTWIQGNQNPILLGGWLWMLGCVSFLWFASLLRARLADAEGGQHTYTTLAYAGAVAATALGLLVQAGDVGAAIDHDSISPATAGTLHHLGDMFFVGAELALILFFAGSAVVALRTGVLPKWWALFAVLIAVVLVIGPIGWAALIFGTPVWTLGTGLVVGSRPRARRRVPSPATALCSSGVGRGVPPHPSLRCSVGWGRRTEQRLAVDLGTANTVVYETGKGVIAFEPSVVAVDERTGEVYAVGTEARRMIGRTPAHITATRPLRHGVIADFETTEQMLRYFIRSAVRRFGSRAEVMVCIPSGVTQVERSAVEEATVAAGAARVSLIEEPLAAAIGAGLPVADSIGSLVVDVGGGTSEMAVTALGGMVVSHSVRVGGYDLDEAIVRLLGDTGLQIGQEQAEAVKIEIGAARAGGDGPLTAEVAGRDTASGLMRRATVDADAVTAALARPLDQIVEGLELVLERTPPELAADIAGRGVMLVGGGALLRELDALIRSRTGLAVTVAEEPLTTVAIGAGLALEAAPRRRRRR